ncbi:uncharacterized protein (DUF1015 family) [Nonlabens dokdonensis]|uniref:Protein containing DUF1015 n=2 Tax=Nonlabens dokdonensis TaxID=328515 RepID=L7WBW0_NONDD|nr:DUF1015 domain-containing protein [Nonlabens dokdonensis]AGC77712.1 protein containing DUF1015 [Nonlabens dokdonensis DSW-6]PZX39751.1 uncharacterized protein (DUF1015 family) [Nonlabens dokdonensis]
MPKIKPFKGVRAAADKAAHLISRTYQDYGKKELKAQLKYNPYSFLQILNPGYKFNQEISGIERFSLVRNRYLEFKEEGYLIQDEQPAFYLYENIDPHHSYTGIIAGTSTKDYQDNKIKKHEDTLSFKEVLFKDYLKSAGFNAEPVLLTYKDRPDINQMIDQVKKRQPDTFFSTTDFNSHKIWAITDPQMIESLEKQFQEIPELYIADGHHRSASSSLLSQEMDPDQESYHYFMSLLIAENQLNIYEFNRQIKDLNGLTKEEFLIQLDQNFRIQNRGIELYKPSKKHHFSMYLDGEFYSLYLRKGLYEISNPLQDLDTQMLYDLILKPILGIQDLRTDQRIKYSYGKHDIMHIKERVDSKEFAVGFGLFPATVEQMKSIADADLRMPPKSTFIRPKLPSGLIIYEF